MKLPGIMLLVTVILFQACTRTVIVPAGFDAALFSNLPATNIDGKKEVPGKGYGTIRWYAGKAVTYPVMYLGNGAEDSVKDAFALGGFDLSHIKGEIIEARLLFYINYAEKTRKNVQVTVRPFKKAWSADQITYNDVFETTRSGSGLTNMVETDEKKCRLVYWDLKGQKSSFSRAVLPFSFP